MQILRNIDQSSDEWIALRRGRSTSSKVGGLMVTPRNKSEKSAMFYELVAEGMMTDKTEDSGSSMDRGHELESLAIACFENEYKKEVITGGFCISDEDDRLAMSPDGLIDNNGKLTEGVEVKCLGAGLHIKAVITKKIPKKYMPQCLQYFIVNEELETLYFVMYDPRLIAKKLAVFTLHRKDIVKAIAHQKAEQIRLLDEVDIMKNKQTF